MKYYTLFFLFCLCSLFAQADNKQDLSQSVLRWVQTSQADSIRAVCTDEVKAQLTTPYVNSLWQQLTTQMGAFKKQNEWTRQTIEPYELFRSELYFEKASLIFSVTIDKDNKVAGFFFLPANQKQ